MEANKKMLTGSGDLKTNESKNDDYAVAISTNYGVSLSNWSKVIRNPEMEIVRIRGGP